MWVKIVPNQWSLLVGDKKQFQATVYPASTDPRVTWRVNTIDGGNSTFGMVDANGMYTAPAVVPSQEIVTVTAVSVADTTKNDSATVRILPPPNVHVTITPSSVSVYTNAAEQFEATVTGTTNMLVTWTVNTIAGGNATVGTINAKGLYLAPASVPNPAVVSVSAISQADTSKAAAAAIKVLPSTPFGTYTITVTGSAGSLNRTTDLTLKVVP
ncbi:MAG TPA: hypothetical protein VMT53_21630 [Terriglobales bacterium]|nr:hypothetical protein [Terriglobales bacterium]